MSAQKLFAAINESLLELNETYKQKVVTAKEGKKAAPPLPQSLKRLLKEYAGIMQDFANRGELDMRQSTTALYMIHRIDNENIGFATLIKALNQRLLSLFSEAIALENAS